MAGEMDEVEERAERKRRGSKEMMNEWKLRRKKSAAGGGIAERIKYSSEDSQDFK